jgi:hypothetical protein
MNRADAYDVASNALREYEALGYSRLSQLVGYPQPPSRHPRSDGAFTVVVVIRWVDDPGGSIRVEATVEGSSTWRLERQTEALVVHPKAEEPNCGSAV